jgi:hypothetical protein
MAKIIKSSTKILLDIEDFFEYILKDLETDSSYVTDKLNDLFDANLEYRDIQNAKISMEDDEVLLLIPEEEKII